MKIKPLTGHISPETAYIVDDYPYGFTLRCKMRYWIESHPKLGFRLCMQSSNPKKPGEYWNKPKKSTYSYVCEGLYLDENSHVKACALSQYSDYAESVKFRENWHDCLNSDALENLDLWIKMKKIYEEKIRPKYDAMPMHEIKASEPILLSSLVRK